MSDITSSRQTPAQLLIRSLVQQNVKYIFGIPDGKIMPTFDVLRDEGPRLIVCRHEQNAAFMAADIGRLTGRPGVSLVTSGPGTGNLVTGAATATTEGDPMVAIGGVVPLPDTLKQTHQSMDSVAIMKPVTKFSVAINAPEAAGEAVVNAFRAAMAPRAGASFIAFPKDVQRAATEAGVPPILPLPSLGAPPPDLIRGAAETISKAKSPVILLGMGAGDPDATAAVRALLKRHPVPAVGTFQGAGAVSRELLPLFFGRVGLFRNQPGDKVLAGADLVLTVGYDPVEYDPSFWNVGKARAIIHLDSSPCEIDNHYQPELELLFSNGQQTLGVGIPWAMSASLTYPAKKVVAVVGDGGFLYSSMELETAVRLKLNITVIIFRDGGYNMFAFQQELINPYLVKYAESLGCVGLRVNTPDDLLPTLRKALETPGIVVLDIPTEYSRNVEIGKHVIPEAWD
jgi:thiamine pyrophosphate-dependent acetolactate synthase large subunit-like protein